MCGQVLDYVSRCVRFQTSMYERVRYPRILQPLPIVHRKWQSVSMDFIVEFPCTQRQHNVVSMVVDRLTKMVHFIPTKTVTQVADWFIQHIFRIHELRETIVFDRDTHFTEQLLTSLFTNLGTKLKFSSGEHSEIDGYTEWVN